MSNAGLELVTLRSRVLCLLTEPARCSSTFSFNWKSKGHILDHNYSTEGSSIFRYFPIASLLGLFSFWFRAKAGQQDVQDGVYSMLEHCYFSESSQERQRSNEGMWNQD